MQYHHHTRCVSAMEKFWDGERCWGVKPGAGGPWGVAEGGKGGKGPGGSFAGGACSPDRFHVGKLTAAWVEENGMLGMSDRSLASSACRAAARGRALHVSDVGYQAVLQLCSSTVSGHGSPWKPLRSIARSFRDTGRLAAGLQSAGELKS